MTRSGRESLPQGRDAFPEGQQWLGGPTGGPGVVGRQSRMAGSGLEALPEGQE